MISLLIGVGFGLVGLGIGYSLVSYVKKYYKKTNPKENTSKGFITDMNYIPSIEIIKMTVDNISSSDPNWYIVSGYKDIVQRKLEELFLDKRAPSDDFNDFWYNSDSTTPDKIYVEYKLNNDIFSIIITDLHLFFLSSTTKQKIPRRIISAYYVNDYGKSNNITKLLTSFMGPFYNFYNDVDGVSNKFLDMLSYGHGNFEGIGLSHIVINDLYGETHEYKDLVNGSIDKW